MSWNIPVFQNDGLLKSQLVVGFGSQTRGHLDYPSGTWVDSTPGAPSTYVVDTLDAEGPGSITDAWSEDGRRIVFDVAGEIDFTEITNPNVTFSRSYITVDGWTAPSPGITFKDVASLKMSAAGPPGSKYPVHDVVVKGIRCVGRGSPEAGDHRWEFERGADNVGWDLWEMNGSESVNVAGYPSGDPNVYRVVFDRCATDGSGNGSFEIYGDVEDVTVQRCFTYFSPQGQHLSEATSIQRRITFWNNVYGWVAYRMPRWRYAKEQIDFVANVLYGAQWCELESNGASYMASDGAGGSSNSANYVKNTVLHVEGNDVSVADATFEASQIGSFADGFARIRTGGNNNLPAIVDPDDWRDRYFCVRDHSSTSDPGGGRGNNGMYRLHQVNTAQDDWEIRKVNIVQNIDQGSNEFEIPEVASTPESITIRTRGPLHQEPRYTIGGSWSGDLYIPDSGDDSNIWSQAILDSVGAGSFQEALADLRTSTTPVSMVHNGNNFAAPRTVPNIRDMGHPYPTAEEIEMLDIIATAAGQ